MRPESASVLRRQDRALRAPPQPRTISATMKPTAPERWSLDAGDAASATLTIPADAHRERRFEIACAHTVGVPADATGAWHQMTVRADGTQQWQRRVAASNPEAWDGLDYRFSRSVPVGQALRITVSVTCGGVHRRRLVIEAEEHGVGTGEAGR
jgi:hypothetical protein